MNISARPALIGALLGLLACPLASASNIVTLDFAANSDDEVTKVDASSAGRLYMLGSTRGAGGGNSSSNDGGGIFGLDMANPLGNPFGSNGRFLPVTPIDFLVRPDGSLLSLELLQGALHVVARDPAGNTTMTSVAITDYGYSLALQPDGKILVGGGFAGSYPAAASPAAKVTRLNPDGTLDATFSSPQLPLGQDVGITQMVPLPGGKIAIAYARAPYTTNSTSAIIVALLNSDGTLDTGFGTNSMIDFGGTGATAIAADTQGRIYVLSGANTVRRVLQDGTVDSTFTSGPLDPSITLTGLALDAMQRVMVFGDVPSTTAGVDGTGFLARLTTTGSLDASFGGTGEIVVTLPRAPIIGRNYCFGSFQSDGKPVLACAITGQADSGVYAPADVAVARYNVDGTADASLGAAIPNFQYYPDAFSFQTAAVPYGTAYVVSNPVTVTGINVNTSVSGFPTDVGAVIPAGISIGCTGQFTYGAVISPGQSFCVRYSASTQPGGTVTVQVNVGGRVAPLTINSTNTPATTTPNPFSFTNQSDVELSAVILSNPVTITGITGFANVTVSGDNGFASYVIGCDPNKQHYPANQVSNGDTICVQEIASSTPGVSETATLTVGGVSADFTITTKAAAAAPPPPPSGNSGSNPPSETAMSGGGGGGALDELSLGALVGLTLVCARRRLQLRVTRGR